MANGNLQWRGPTTKSFAVLGSDITNTTPFSTPVTPAGALYYRFVSAINLSTADHAYTTADSKPPTSSQRASPDERASSNLPMKTSSRKNQSGSSLIIVLTTLSVLMVVVGIAAEYTNNVNRVVVRTTTLKTATAAADATIEKLFANWRAVCRATPTSPLPTNSFTSLPLPTYSTAKSSQHNKFCQSGNARRPDGRIRSNLYGFQYQSRRRR